MASRWLAFTRNLACRQLKLGEMDSTLLGSYLVVFIGMYTCINIGMCVTWDALRYLRHHNGLMDTRSVSRRSGPFWLSSW